MNTWQCENMTVNKCRFCDSIINVTFVDLGVTPLSNSFLKYNDLDKFEKRFPLKAIVCEKCFLVQIQIGRASCRERV